MSDDEIHIAGLMWANGKDTAAIAAYLQKAEFMVYRYIDRIKRIAEIERRKVRGQ